MVLTHRWIGVNDWDGMGFNVGFNAFFPPLSNGIITGLPSVDDSVCFQDVVVFAWTYPWCLDIDISWPHLWETESLMQISEQPIEMQRHIGKRTVRLLMCTLYTPECRMSWLARSPCSSNGDFQPGKGYVQRWTYVIDKILNAIK